MGHRSDHHDVCSYCVTTDDFCKFGEITLVCIGFHMLGDVIYYLLFPEIVITVKNEI